MPFDEYGLPLGPAREATLTALAEQACNASHTDGLYLTLCEATPQGDTFEVDLFIHQVCGNPIGALWGVDLDDGICAAILTHRTPLGTLAVLCTRVGDTATFAINPHGTLSIGHGELPAGTATTVALLRRCLGLHDNLDPAPAVSLLAAWTAATVLRVVDSWTVTDGPLPDDEAVRIAWLCVATGLTEATTDAEVAEQVEPFRDIHGHAWASQDAVDKVSAAAAELADTLTWADLAASPLSGLLPAGLRAEDNPQWGGDGLLARWAMTAWPTVDESLTQLAALNPAAADAVAAVLETVRWWAPQPALRTSAGGRAPTT